MHSWYLLPRYVPLLEGVSFLEFPYERDHCTEMYVFFVRSMRLSRQEVVHDRSLLKTGFAVAVTCL